MNFSKVEIIEERGPATSAAAMAANASITFSSYAGKRRKNPMEVTLDDIIKERLDRASDETSPGDSDYESTHEGRLPFKVAKRRHLAEAAKGAISSTAAVAKETTRPVLTASAPPPQPAAQRPKATAPVDFTVKIQKSITDYFTKET